jgi:hypothetical protein
MDLANFFSAAEARMDRWSQINTTARSWENALKGGRPTEKLKAEASSIDFMRTLDVKEIHGYRAAEGLQVIKPAVLDRTKLAAGRIS